ncbi:MAG: hypothetical protein ABSA33_01125 [Candidatus Micrarchaeaceae archaeon]|jgi:hypothetical protein
MDENEISIEINCPVGEVFDFTVNPKNTPLWIDSIVEEQASEFPAQVGTEYKNVSRNGDWTQYKVTQLKQNKVFELKQKSGLYHVLYKYEALSESRTRFTYIEWVDSGDIEHPFTTAVLKKLKNVVELTKKK